MFMDVSPGDTITPADIGQNTLAPGTVVLGSENPIPRVVADWAKNDMFIFTDQGPMLDASFTVLSVPDKIPGTPKRKLFEDLFYAGFDDGFNDFRMVANPDQWERRADWVNNNFVRKGTVLAIIDSDDDIWTAVVNSNKFAPLTSFDKDMTRTEIDDLYGVKMVIEA